MGQIPLMEGERGAYPFIVNRSQPFLTEQRNGISFTRIPGRFSVCDSVNGNNRRYPKRVWEKNLSEGSKLRQAISKNAAFGLLEHPADGRISLQSPICILVTDAKLQSAQDESTKQAVDEVVGEIIVLNTAEGQKLRALIEVGYNPLVSSRGFGSVVKAGDGVDEVQEDYVCEGWDVVLTPSFATAELRVPRESQEESLTEAQPTEVPAGQAESTAQPLIKCSKCGEVAVVKYDNGGYGCKACGAKSQGGQTAQVPNTRPLFRPGEVPESNLPKVASSPEAAAAPSAASANKTLTENIMTINEIKSRIGAVAGTSVPKDPARFAEGLNEMAQLHQSIAEAVAAEPKASWQGQQLHDQLSRIEKTWSESVLAPAKAATKLHENYTKVLKVTKVLGEAAIGIRKKLSEALAQNAEAAQLVEELTERGQAWVAIADKRKEHIARLDHQLEVACEALEIIKKRYHEDMTEMGRHVITLEFAEKAQAPEIQKLLKEAKKPKDIIAIREKLDPEGAKTPKQEEQKPKEGEPAAQQESKAEKPKETAPAPAAKQEGKDSAPAADSEARVLVPSVRSISESVAMVQRLSSAKEPSKETEKAAK